MAQLHRIRAVIISILVFSAHPAHAQFIFPADAGVLKVTDFGAVANDGVDDTAAFKAAIEAAVGPTHNRYVAPPIYIPDGIYDLTGSIECRLADQTTWHGWRSGCYFVGQSRDKTVLKLADHATGFSDPNAPLAVFKTGSELSGFPDNTNGAGNEAFNHFFKHLTVDTGVGNPGAIGIDYLSNNLGSIEDVTIRSSDPNGVGVAGISMIRYGPGPALIKNLCVQGFDTGILISSSEYIMTLEHISLSGQRVAGINLKANNLSIRDLQSVGSKPVLINAGTTFLTDARLTGTDITQKALINQAALYARNVSSVGYGTIFDQSSSASGGAATVLGGPMPVTVREFSSTAPKFLFDSPVESTNLQILETPDYIQSDLTKWVSVTSKGATSTIDSANAPDDDAPAIQSAINAGKEIVYFPNGIYHTCATITIPANSKVRKLVGFRAAIFVKPGCTVPTILRVEGPFATTVQLEDLRFEGALELATTKQVTLKHMTVRTYVRSTAGSTGDLYVEDIGTAIDIESPMRMWARQLDLEGSTNGGPLLTNRGGTIWVLGLKTESEIIAVDNGSGGTIEANGFIFPIRGQAQERPMLVNADGSLFACVAQTGNRIPKLLHATRNGITRDILAKEWNGRSACFSDTPRPRLLAGYTIAGNLLKSGDSDAESTASDLMIGAGLTGTTFDAGRLIVPGLSIGKDIADAMANEKALIFTMDSPGKLNIDQIILDIARSDPFDDFVRVMSSADNYSSFQEFKLRNSFASVDFGYALKPAFRNATGPVTFKVYLYGAAATETTCTTCKIILDDISLRGSVNIGQAP